MHQVRNDIIHKKKLSVQGCEQRVISLSYQDSNLDKQSQNLLCYHYTIAQCAPKVSKRISLRQGVI